MDSDTEEEKEEPQCRVALPEHDGEDSDDEATSDGLGELFGCCNLENRAKEVQEMPDLRNSRMCCASTVRCPAGQRLHGSSDPLSIVSCINACDIVYPQEVNNANISMDEFIDLEVILDSGAGAHVASKRHLPGYEVRDSDLKRAGAAFVAVDGGRLENEGEALLNVVVEDGKGQGHNVRTTVQVADVTRALWSVGVLCDAGLDPRFTRDHAKIFDSRGVELCHFNRKNGLYVAKIKLRNPLFKGFQRPGAN